ncbi:hypothetical protein [Herbidospora mongoliensis]|uniref:hypothetical protein n=1 Tax=Herbidospora mongoliensis TaxID=688067 RepID=UPI0008366D60|nr:hypothetical protein [Herbidospora mongoliensis]
MSVTHIVNLDLTVDYSQAYLVDEEYKDSWDCQQSSDVGILLEGKGVAQLIFGIQYGTVPFTLMVADQDPGPDLDGHEDIVEIDFDSPSGRVGLREWGEQPYPFVSLPAGPGIYRLRYHVLGMDEEATEDHYLLQIWPAKPGDSVVLKATTETFQYWLDACRPQE